MIIGVTETAAFGALRVALCPADTTAGGKRKLLALLSLLIGGRCDSRLGLPVFCPGFAGDPVEKERPDIFLSKSDRNGFVAGLLMVLRILAALSRCS